MNEEAGKPGRAAWRDVTVGDVDGSARRAFELGGAVFDGPRKIDGRDFRVIRDPADAVLARITP